jgi:hypothetical protein
MGTTAYPSTSGSSSSIKSIQRGVAASAGSITISSVNMSKTVCQSFPTGAGGTVSGTGSVPTATIAGTGGIDQPFGYALTTASRAVSANNANFTPGNLNAYYASPRSFATFNFPAGTLIGYGGRYGTSPIYSPNAFSQSVGISGYNQVTPYMNSGSAGSPANINYSTAVSAAPAQTITKPAQTISGGTTNIIAKEYGIYLSNSTTIVATGPCRYEVTEYY